MGNVGDEPRINFISPQRPAVRHAGRSGPVLGEDKALSFTAAATAATAAAAADHLNSAPLPPPLLPDVCCTARLGETRKRTVHLRQDDVMTPASTLRRASSTLPVRTLEL